MLHHSLLLGFKTHFPSIHLHTLICEKLIRQLKAQNLLVSLSSIFIVLLIEAEVAKAPLCVQNIQKCGQRNTVLLILRNNVEMTISDSTNKQNEQAKCIQSYHTQIQEFIHLCRVQEVEDLHLIEDRG